MQELKADTGVKVKIGPVVGATSASSPGITPVTNLTLAGADETGFLKHDATGVTSTATTNVFDAIASADGYYNLTLTTGNVDTEGMLEFFIHDDSLIVPHREEFMVVSGAYYNSKYNTSSATALQVDVIGKTGYALTATGYGSVWTSGTRTLTTATNTTIGLTTDAVAAVWAATGGRELSTATGIWSATARTLTTATNIDIILADSGAHGGTGFVLTGKALDFDNTTGHAASFISTDGSSNGMEIVGGQEGMKITGGREGLLVTGANDYEGAKFVGNGQGAGIKFQGGIDSGNGLEAVGGAANGRGIYARGVGTGNAFYLYTATGISEFDSNRNIAVGSDGRFTISTDAMDRSGTLDVNTKTLTAGAITASAIATDAVDADALATDAVAEIWAATGGRTLTTATNLTVNDLTTKTGFELTATGYDSVWTSGTRTLTTATNTTIGLTADAADVVWAATTRTLTTATNLTVLDVTSGVSIQSGGFPVGGFAAGAITDAAISSAAEIQIATVVLNQVVESKGAITLRQFGSLALAALAGQTASGGALIYNPTGGTLRIAAILSATANERTTISITPST